MIDFKTGGVSSREPQMTVTEIEEFVAAAKEFKKQTFAHATGDSGIENAIEGGGRFRRARIFYSRRSIGANAGPADRLGADFFSRSETNRLCRPDGLG